MTAFVCYHLVFLTILKLKQIGINNMLQDKEYGIVQIKMYFIDMAFEKNKLYGLIILEIQLMR